MQVVRPSSRVKMPRNTDPTRWDNELPIYLDDYMNVYNNLTKAQPWEAELCREIYPGIQDIVLTHFKESSKSRVLFSGMPTEHWMQDGQFVLTKRNFAILHPPIAKQCEEHVVGILRDKCLAIQQTILEILPVILASDVEISQVRSFFQAADFFFDNLAEHLCEQDYWETELVQRYPLISYLRDRETVVDRLITFEEWKMDPSKFNDRQTTMNQDAKFRISAATIIKKMNITAMEKLTHYESVHPQKPFLVRGKRYLDYLEASISETALVKTNFTTLTRNALVLLRDVPVLSPSVRAILRERAE